VAILQQRLDSFDHAGDSPLGVAGASAPDEVGVLAGREERRHGIDVGGKRHGERAAPLDKDVETPRLHFHALDPAIVKSRQGSQVVVEVLAHPLFVIGDRFDIDQRPCEFEYVHKISVSWGED
jgi:hypothetical protein